MLDQARYSQHIWNIIVEGDAMPGIMGAVVKTDDKHWPSFQSALEEAWAEPVPDTELLKEKFCGGDETCMVNNACCSNINATMVLAACDTAFVSCCMPTPVLEHASKLCCNC